MLSEKEILAIQPFSKIMGRIDYIKSLMDPAALSGNSYQIITGLGRFKLRCCIDVKTAKRIESNVLLLPDYLPKFIGREGQFLLFEWIDGDRLMNHTLDDCYRIGKMMGEAHSLEQVRTDKVAGDFFNSKLQKSGNAISDAMKHKLKVKFNEFISKLDVDIVLEFNDVHRANFMKDKDGNIFYVDEEGLDYKIKGLGLAKPLLTEKWMKTKEEQDAFWRGYNEHASSDYFDRDYQKFIYFMQLLRAIASRVESNRDYSKIYEQLVEFLNDN